MTALHAVTDADIAERAAAVAYMPTRSWGYGNLSWLLDRIGLNCPTPARKHCGCPGCTHGFMHIPAVSR